MGAYTSSADSVLDALGDKTRRAIVASLKEGPRSVTALAADLPVSRPAVSQHLQVLARAGLVSAERSGTRRMYRLEAKGLQTLRQYVDAFWEDVLTAFAKEAEREER